MTASSRSAVSPIVLGYSGLDQGVPYKQRTFPGLTARDLRSTHGADSAAAIVGPGGILAAAAEERFTRDKGTGAFPVRAIQACLELAGLRPSDVDVVAHGFDYEPYREVQRLQPGSRDRYDQVYAREVQARLLAQHLPDHAWGDKLVFVPHHLAHAASAFYPSGFEDALVLVADATGEAHNLTIALAGPENIRILHQNGGFHSLGVLYGLFTLHLGFSMGLDEYKVMGLAPYGDPTRHKQQILDLIKHKPDGSFAIPLIYRNKTPLEAENNAGVLRELAALFGPAREPESALAQAHMDLAAGLQAALEDSLLGILERWQRETGQRRLCLAGGVALNCTANGKILRSGLFDQVFVQPASGDDGTALGAALWAQHERAPAAVVRTMGLPLWGPGYDRARIDAAIAARAGELEVTAHADEGAMLAAVADELAAGKIVAWFQGRMEYGPRALGSRSILADPRGAEMREKVNRIVKKREEFRPFAPVVKAEAAGRYFEITPGQESIYAHMLFITDVRPEHRAGLPAITHVNGSARVQTLAREDSPRLWALLDAFEARTRTPLLLNTSFNVRGQPIVCTPEEAIDTFISHSLDLLVLDTVVVKRAAPRGQ